MRADVGNLLTLSLDRCGKFLRGSAVRDLPHRSEPCHERGILRRVANVVRNSPTEVVR